MKRRIHVDQHAIRANKHPGPCSGCEGSGEERRIANSEWPKGDGPYYEFTGDACSRCKGSGKEQRPPISVKTYRSNDKCYGVTMTGPSRVVYSPDKPLSCGAKVWIETEYEVTLDNGESI
jgi:DnaJ-class molecular chaperone